MNIEAVRQLRAEGVPVTQACQALALSRATFYRAETLSLPAVRETSRHPRALSNQEKNVVLETLHSERFIDKPPAQVYASLLDEGVYLCSIRTMYRILHENHEVRERRNQLKHPKYVKPRLRATRPNELWSWDITKLSGPVKWTYYYLYVIIDVFSRYVVGWMVAEGESSGRAQRLIEESCRRQCVNPGDLTLHADRGSSMTSKGVAHLLADLGITQSHSRPRVSNDNPYSEAQFKTLKYRPTYPGFFENITHARQWARETFDWYNHEHYHKGIGLMTPYQVHHGLISEVQSKRQDALERARQAHPERFVRGSVSPPQFPSIVWINQPSPDDDHLA